jgi:Fe-S cluster biogenesis protein NfuA
MLQYYTGKEEFFMEQLQENVRKVLAQVRPTLQRDGGDVEFVDLDADMVVKVRLTGACKGCPMSRITLKEGIEKFVKSEIPSIRAVEAVE